MNHEDGMDWILITNTPESVKGIAIVRKGFKARLHSHLEEEGYHFLYGTGLLSIHGESVTVNSPYFITIPSNAIHAMTPISEFVILLFTFPKGPFEEIKYHYTDQYLQLLDS